MRFANHQIWNEPTRSQDIKAESAKMECVLRVRHLLAASCLAITLAVAGTPLAAGLPAFPGAEGGGALAVGGRGGAVCKVTNLEDSGPGSLRSCIEMEGPRTVIFEVGGTIKLKSLLRIENPYITIAGQTAPGGGIQLKADKQVDNDSVNLTPMLIDADHVIIRFLRVRKGFTGSRGNIRVVSGSNIILDHLSMAWSESQNWTIDAWDSSSIPSNITMQNTILTEMLDGRVMMLLSSKNERNRSMTNIDHHNNFIAHSSHRNPSAWYASGRWVNNIFYHWTSWAARSMGGVQHDWISNLWKPGPTPPGSRGQQELQFMPAEYSFGGSRKVYFAPDRLVPGDPSIYVAGNRGLQSGMSPHTDNWPYTRVTGARDDPEALHPNGSPMEVPPIGWRRTEPLPDTPIPITVRHVDELEDHLLPIVGASMRLDCGGNWVPNRDAADARAIQEYLDGEGYLAEQGEGEEVYGGHPSLAAGTACVDSSGDGVPDEWAIAAGFDPEDSTLGTKVHESGYTYLELYLNDMKVTPARPSAVRMWVE